MTNPLDKPAALISSKLAEQCPVVPADNLILIVDDLSNNLRVLSGVLAPMGYQLSFANSGKQALERVQAAKPDLILLDLMMPEMDGLEVMRRLKQDSEQNNTPVIFLTASQDSEHLLEAFELGAVDYLTKPFQAPELLARIKTHLELKQLRDRIFCQARYEWIFGQITKNIHDSLELNNILQHTVDTIQQLLVADRVLVCHRAAPDQCDIIAIATTDQFPVNCNTVPLSDLISTLPSVSGLELSFAPSSTLGSSSLSALQPSAASNSSTALNPLTAPNLPTAQIRQFEPTVTQTLPTVIQEFISHWQVKAEISVPIIKQGDFWGWLIAHNCQDTEAWGEDELELLKRIAEQFAIAIQQAELYQQLQAANQELERASNTDALCNIANRRYFNHCIDQEWRRMRREQQPLSVILFDVDHFKGYNDTYGHLAGDLCLQQVAATAAGTLRRPADLIARYGGEEFAVVLPNTSLAGTVELAESIRQAIEAMAIPHAATSVPTATVTVSLGIASWIPTREQSIMQLLNQADLALYDAKRQGRNRVAIATACPPPTQ